MTGFRHPLAYVRVASPCKADWDEMIGTEQVRFCGQCNLNVYNLSGMTRDQAESVIAANEGRLCVRFYRRRDGSIITQDCPVGLRAARQRVAHTAKAIGVYALALLASFGVHRLFPGVVTPLRHPSVMGAMAIRHDIPPVVSPQSTRESLGEMAYPGPMPKHKGKRQRP
ncbi:MAG TPA: hypothetical protein VE961_02215 [Pyrinomonadaceae bacterium]|nr:hypothetical protein [Pyrinomonadaceae bacterium]